MGIKKLSNLKHKVNKQLSKFLFNIGIDSIPAYLTIAETIPGWVTWQELSEKVRYARSLPTDAQIVEIGAFLGRSTVVLAGARKLEGSGMVHTIDPFDASGETFSQTIYKKIENELNNSLLNVFVTKLRSARVEDYVKVYQGTAESVVQTWNTPIDMLVLDGDQSPKGARSAYNLWIPFLKPGGILVLHNSSERIYEEGHDGHHQLVLDYLRAPNYTDIHCVRTTTFARLTESLQ
jgi:predicted O-methyltransferase YrrM